MYQIKIELWKNYVDDRQDFQYLSLVLVKNKVNLINNNDDNNMNEDVEKVK